MARRKNASFTGSPLHGSGSGSRELVEVFYAKINKLIPGSTPVPIPPLESVHPKHDEHTQAFIFADYAVRKFAPIVLEAAGLKAEASKLRKFPEIVDGATKADAARAARSALWFAGHTAKDAVDGAKTLAARADAAGRVAFKSYNSQRIADAEAARADAAYKVAARMNDAVEVATDACEAADSLTVDRAASRAARAARAAAKFNPDATWAAVTEMLNHL